MGQQAFFILNNRKNTSAEPAGKVLVDVVRNDCNLKGTTVACREGDCGACTVLVGSWQAGEMRYRSITSCISPFANAWGKHIVTVEGLSDGFGVNPVQKAIMESAGTQCGFCTPGFVVSLTGFLLSAVQLRYEEAISAIDGNICRCTGYKSIERAVAQLVAKLGEQIDYRKNRVECLVELGVLPAWFTEVPDWLAIEPVLEKVAGFSSVEARISTQSGESLGGDPSTTPSMSKGKGPRSQRAESLGGGPSTAPRSLRYRGFARDDKGLPARKRAHASQVVAGGTDLYVQKPDGLCSRNDLGFTLDGTCPEGIFVREKNMIVGGATRIEDFRCSELVAKYFPNIRTLLKLFASTQIRNQGTIAGNIVNASPIGDLSNFFLALEATLHLVGGKKPRRVALKDFYKGYKSYDLVPGEVIRELSFALPDSDSFVNLEKISRRRHLDIASVTTSMHVKISAGKVRHAAFSAGGVAPIPLFLKGMSRFLLGKKLSSEVVEEALRVALAEVAPINDVRGSASYKRVALRQLLRAHFLSCAPGLSEGSGVEGARGPSLGNSPKGTPLPGGEQAGMRELQSHVKGESEYIDDLAVPEGTVYGHVFYARCAHAAIVSLDTSEAAKQPGVLAVLSAKDVPGANQIGGIVEDEPLLADGAVHFFGQPIALVVAETEAQAKAASKLIQIRFAEKPVIIDPREAAKKGEFLVPPVTFAQGDTVQAFKQCTLVVEGSTETGGQEHLYLEPQGALAVPSEQGGILVHSSTQGPTAVQRTIAKVLGMPMHQVDVDVRRLGGAFGGKEDQATPWAVLAALGTFRLRRPVKVVLHRIDDMRMTGKRHPYSSDFKIGLNQEGKILAYEVTFYQNGGAATDLSPAVLSRSLFHAANAYYIPNVKAIGYSCRTNLPPNTAFRGFGGPQGMFVIEAAICKAAEALGIDAAVLQKKNLLHEGDTFHYGQKALACKAGPSWESLEEKCDVPRKRAEVAAFNKANSLYKKGLAFMPICFGISFTKTPMNQASALVHIYQDGSVGVSTAAVEMGQGVNTKVLQVVARTLGVEPGRVRIASTNTSRIANTSPTAASSGADLNGKATEKACLLLKERLRALEAPGLTWEKLVEKAYLNRVSLSAQAHYATPDIYFDLKKSKGAPFAYHVYGTSLTEVTLDTLRGRYEVDCVNIVHDFGRSLHWNIDLGQVEGGLMQGIGWMTVEELLFNAQGKPLTDTLSTYKVPDIYAAPKNVAVHALDPYDNPLGVANSKAVGEPPLMYGIGTFFALRQAMRAYRPDAYLLHAPLTPERVLMALHGNGLQ